MGYIHHERPVQIQSVSTILPATATPPRDSRYFLSNIDLLCCWKFYCDGIYYFAAPASKQQHQHEFADLRRLFDTLKDSLSRTLVHFPILAGRIKQAENGRLEVDFSDEGVTFIEALVHARLDDWEDIKDCPFETQLNPLDTCFADYATAPLLRIQVNVFGCGGIAIGVSNMHEVIDGMALAQFSNAWSEVHRGVAISSPPHFEPSLLRPRDPPQVKHAMEKDYISSEALFEYGDNTFTLPQKPSPFQTIVIQLSSQQVDGLIDDIERGPYSYGKATSFEAVAAFAWKVITEARDLPDATVTRFGYPIDIRQLWVPKLPRGYFGNATHLSSLPLKAGDIKKNHVSFTAKAIHGDKFAVTKDGEFVKSLVDWIQVQLDEGKHIRLNTEPFSGRDVQSSTLVSIPFYEMDLGWGKPIHFSFPICDTFGDGIVTVLRTEEGGRSRCLNISMNREHVKRLFETELFRRFQPNLTK